MSHPYEKRGARTHILKSTKTRLIDAEQMKNWYAAGPADYNNVEVVGNRNIAKAGIKASP